MSQGKGKASSSRRRSSDDHVYGGHPRPESSFDDPPLSAPASSFDASIPFNLPPRRSMKMLKDGSDFVWPEAAHSLFVRGLQTWKYMNINSKRTRAPRGEGKTDFLVRYLQTHGVERTKKQVASHLQVLRTEWRNSDNTLLLSLVDDTVPHTRSLSEPSLPPSSPSNNSNSSPLSVFNPVPDHGDDRAISTPSLPSPISSLPPAPSNSSLYHPAHVVYNNSYQQSVSSDAFRSQPAVNTGPWQPDDSVWNTAAASEPYNRPVIHHPIPSYDPPTAFHDYDRTPRPAPHSTLEPRGYSSNYYASPHRGGASSSSIAAPLARTPHSLTSLSPETGGPSYPTYNPPTSYPLSQSAAQSHSDYGNVSMEFGTQPYQPHYRSGAGLQADGGIAMSSASSYGGAVEPAFLPAASEHVQQPPQWVRPPAARYPRPPERHRGSPKH